MALDSPRIKYQKLFAAGRIVNLGCGEDPAGFGDSAVHVDLDFYNHKNFVHADIHNLPFHDDEFDTAVLGDVLEHSPEPAQMLREAGRVAKKVVATVFEEWRLKKEPGKDYIQLQIDSFNEDLKKIGYSDYFTYMKTLPDHKDTLLGVTSDEKFPHHPHLQEFTAESLLKYVDDAGLEPIIRFRFLEGFVGEDHLLNPNEGPQRAFYNWLLVMRKKG